MSGVSQISDVIEAAKETAGGAVQTLIAVADGLEMPTTGADLRRVATALDSDEFRLLIIGRFNNGKSTLANALLAAIDRPVPELDGTEGPLVPGDLPATAVLTWVRYGTQARVTAEELTKERVTWPLSQYLADSVLDGYGDDEADRERFGRLHHFDMEYPAVACKTGLIIGDSPGFSHNTDRSAITADASQECDAVIAVFNSAAPFGMDEMNEVGEIIPSHIRVFWVVNLMNRPTADERLRASTWNKLLKERHSGEPWHGQNLADSDVFFVNARDAFYAARAGDAEAAAASGFTRFEERIAAFYANYAVPAHVERCAGGALGFAAEMQDAISGFLGAATADQEDFALAYEAQVPVLDEVRTAPGRIAGIIDRTQEMVADIADISFQKALNTLIDDLPGHLEGIKLETGHIGDTKLSLSVFVQKKLAGEISGHIEAFVKERMTAWRERDLPAAAEPQFREMQDRIAAVAGEVEARFDEIHASLPSLGTHAKAKRAVGWGQRIVVGAGHLVIGDFVGAAAAGAGGWQGGAGALAGGLAATVGLVLAGVAWGPLAIAVIVAAQAAGGIGAAQIRLERRAVGKVRTAAEKEIARFRTGWSTAVRETIEQQFAGIKARIVEDATLIINEKIREIEAMQQLNRQGAAERAAASERFTGLLADVKKAGELLEGSMAAAQQA